jgi:hypothetical protein
MPDRQPQPSDLLAASDIADLFGWPVSRADSLIRALVREGVPTYRIEGFSRRMVKRGDIEARIVEHTWK